MAPKLTLICPTYQRHHYLERSCRFWGNRIELCVLYADGSEYSFPSANVQSENIQYFHQPVSIHQRLLNMLELVKTPYVCMLGDDEFYIPSSLNSCVEFLDTHSDYVACMGRAVGFSNRGGNAVFSCQYPKLHDRDLESELPFRRLIDHFSAYVPAHCYAVTRVDVFREAMTKALSCNLDIFAIFELIEEFIVVSNGKTCVLPELYWLRSHEAPPIRNTGDLSLDPSKSFNKWWVSEEPSAIAERLAFCDELALVTDCGLTHEEVESVFECYVKNTSRSQISLGRRIRSAIFKAIKSVAPTSFVDRINEVKFLINNRDALQELRNQGVSIDETGLAECVAAIEASIKP